VRRLIAILTISTGLLGCSSLATTSSEPYNLISPQGPGLAANVVSSRWRSSDWVEIDFRLQRTTPTTNWHLKAWEPIYLAAWDAQGNPLMPESVLVGSVTLGEGELSDEGSFIIQTFAYKAPIAASRVKLIFGNTTIETTAYALPARP
jgi:hypothetical protein